MIVWVAALGILAGGLLAGFVAGLITGWMMHDRRVC